LQRGDFVLVYPEQSLWWNYKKPKPLKTGAFKFAVKKNVPVVPCFITMQDSEFLDKDGFPIQEYTIHIEKPLYQNKELPKAEQIQDLLSQNYNLWKNCYEKTYGIELKYLKNGD
jgi:1-acyl-sn-glycerol-3-phosphate acyltransferase